MRHEACGMRPEEEGPLGQAAGPGRWPHFDVWKLEMERIDELIPRPGTAKEQRCRSVLGG